MKKYIFITGGVMSSLGKGITSASLGRILKSEGYNVTILKFDPYLNIDAGSQNPFQHGEVFVTEDGAETDLDLGHYERFLNENLSKENNVTSGQIYEAVIKKERKGDYLGSTIQIIPHVTDEIKRRIRYVSEEKHKDITIVEVGGTVGDIESLPFLEAIREFKMEECEGNVAFIHLTYIPYLKTTGELKTKPTQHSVGELRKIGIQPNIIIARGEKDIGKKEKNKIALFTNVRKENIFSLSDVDLMYKVPLILYEAGISSTLSRILHFNDREAKLDSWKEMINKGSRRKGTVKLAIVGKYVELQDAYLSLNEAIRHASFEIGINVSTKWIEAETLESSTSELKGMNGILVPGGFGKRGVEGMIVAAQFAREKRIPYLGICLGMQIAVIEFARNVLGWKDAHSTEFSPETSHPVIDLMEEQKNISNKGGTMRLGAYRCDFIKDSLIKKVYGNKAYVFERHRHRYELNNRYREALESKGLEIDGEYVEKHLGEAIHLQGHPFFVGVQFHPEFKSRPLSPHPLFLAFIRAMQGTLKDEEVFA